MSQDPFIDNAATTPSTSEDDTGVVVFRSWSPSHHNNASNIHPEITKLDTDIEKTRKKLHNEREYGRQIKLNRLQNLDALETKRVTLTEILRRMEKELNNRNVYEYGDIVAEVFGERKIYAHRAIGLESLLCQYMMLAKQHQLKIMKKAGKDIQNHYKHHKLVNKDEYHSYDALCVQVETSRLTLEAIYDDIFQSQHRLLAKLKFLEAGGSIEDYSILYSKEKKTTSKTTKRPTTVQVKTNHWGDSDDDNDKKYENILTSPSSGEFTKEDDIAAAMDILTSPKHGTSSITGSMMANPTLRVSTNTATTSSTTTTTIAPPAASFVTSKSTNQQGGVGGSGSSKSARERRREIEQKRLAKPSTTRFTSYSPGGSNSYDDGDDVEKVRNRIRALEVQTKGIRSKRSEDDDSDELKERSPGRNNMTARKVASIQAN